MSTGLDLVSSSLKLRETQVSCVRCHSDRNMNMYSEEQAIQCAMFEGSQTLTRVLNASEATEIWRPWSCINDFFMATVLSIGGCRCQYKEEIVVKS
jgi:hypothetical protein